MVEEESTELVSKRWQTYLIKMSMFHNLKPSEWKQPQFFGYFCDRFESTFNKKFAISYLKPPTKSTELFMIKSMMATLGTTNPDTIKSYIDWIFEKKIIPNNVKIRSLGFLVNTSFANEFNLYMRDKAKIVKTTELPNEYKQVASTLNLSVNTYGDLAFIKMALDQSTDGDGRAPYKMLFNDLMAIGFKPEILKSLV